MLISGDNRMAQGLKRKARCRWLWTVITVLAIVALVAYSRSNRLSPRVESLLDPNDEDEIASDPRVIRAELAAFTDAEIQQLLRLSASGPLPWPAPDRLSKWLPNAVERRWSDYWVLKRERKNFALTALLHIDPTNRGWVRALETGLRRHPTENGEICLKVLHFPFDDPPKIRVWLSGIPTNRQLSYILILIRFLPKPPPELIQPLIEALNGPAPEDRKEAARALGSYGPAAIQAAPALQQLVKEDPESDVRWMAAWALGMASPEFAAEALSVILPRSGTNQLFDLGIEMCGHLGTNTASAIPALEDALDAAGPHYALDRHNVPAAAALWRIRAVATPRMIDVLRRGVEFGAQNSRILSIQTLAEIGPPASNALPAIEKAIHSRRLYIREIATNALASVRARPKT